eukprot:12932085-Ditylum_brightwellii.AAC.1
MTMVKLQECQSTKRKVITIVKMQECQFKKLQKKMRNVRTMIRLQKCLFTTQMTWEKRAQECQKQTTKKKRS